MTYLQEIDRTNWEDDCLNLTRQLEENTRVKDNLLEQIDGLYQQLQEIDKVRVEL